MFICPNFRYKRSIDYVALRPGFNYAVVSCSLYVHVVVVVMEEGGGGGGVQVLIIV